MNQHKEYEENLKMYLDSIRKDLDIILTSTIPTQKNLMKTILWLNTSILALCIAGLNSGISVLFYSIPFALSISAILLILASLRDGRTKYFGGMTLEYVTSLYANDNQKMQGLYDLSKSIENAFEKNTQIVEKRSKKLSTSTNLTMISIICISLGIIIYVNLNLIKGG
jgi:uncharacterized membrane-anchored protein